MKRLPPKAWITLIRLVRIALGVIFVYSSAAKIVDPAAFATVVTNYRLLPPSLIPAVAVIFPWIEAICGMALILGRWQKGAALMVCLMMVVFTGLGWYNGYRGLNIACGCFSLTAKAPSNIVSNTFRNLILMAAGMWVLFSKDRESTASR